MRNSTGLPYQAALYDSHHPIAARGADANAPPDGELDGGADADAGDPDGGDPDGGDAESD